MAALSRAAADARHVRARDDLPAGAHPLRRRRPGRARACSPPSGSRSSGRATSRALDALYARVIWIPDGEIEPLTDAAVALPRDHRSRPKPTDPPRGAGGEQPGEGTGPAAPATRPTPTAPTRRPDEATDAARRRHDHRRGGRRRPATATDGPQATPSIGSLADALEHALAATRDGVLVQLDEDVRLADVVARAATRAAASRDRSAARGTGAPGGRIPDRGVDRPPFADEQRHARRYAQRLAQAITAGTRADRQAHARRALRRPRLRPRPRPTRRRPPGLDAPVARRRATCARRSRRRTSR